MNSIQSYCSISFTPVDVRDDAKTRWVDSGTCVLGGEWGAWRELADWEALCSEFIVVSTSCRFTTGRTGLGSLSRKLALPLPWRMSAARFEMRSTVGTVSRALPITSWVRRTGHGLVVFFGPRVAGAYPSSSSCRHLSLSTPLWFPALCRISWDQKKWSS